MVHFRESVHDQHAIQSRKRVTMHGFIRWQLGVKSLVVIQCNVNLTYLLTLLILLIFHSKGRSRNIGCLVVARTNFVSVWADINFCVHSYYCGFRIFIAICIGFDRVRIVWLSQRLPSSGFQALIL